MLRSYDYVCGLCGHQVIELFNKGENPDTLDCEGCGNLASMRYAFMAPAVMRASYPDGHKRGEKWQITKAAAQLEHEASKARKSKDHKEAIKLRTEARKLSERVKGKRDNVDK